MRSRNPKMTMDRFREAFNDHGPDIPALMEIFGCSRATVYRWLQKLEEDNHVLHHFSGSDNSLNHLIPQPDPTMIRRRIDDLIEKVFTIGKPMFLAGESGTSKTTIPREIAATLELPFLRISCDSSTDLPELVGGYVLVNGNMTYAEGLLLKIIQVPSIVLFDEINALDPAKSLMLHRLLDSGTIFVKETNTTYAMHPESTIFLAANPPGAGYFVNHMSAALLNRLAVINVPAFTEEEICSVLEQQDHKLPKNVITLLLRFYAEMQRLAREQSMNAQISIRNILTFVDVYRVTKDVKASLDVSFLNGTLMTDSTEVKEACEAIASTVFTDLYPCDDSFFDGDVSR